MLTLIPALPQDEGASFARFLIRGSLPRPSHRLAHQKHTSNQGRVKTRHPATALVKPLSSVFTGSFPVG